MSAPQHVDLALVQWGDRLFYPPNRMVRPDPAPRLRGTVRERAAIIRQRINAAVRQVPQAVVKTTRGAAGMRQIRAHLRYISKDGALEVEDERGFTHTGKEALRDLADRWRYGGSLIGEVSHRKEALFVVLAMPAGTSAAQMKTAVREFAKAALAGHRYVMVLHEHQAQPHVHLSVRMESEAGVRLNPGRADLRGWRETFAEKLRACGIESEATSQSLRGEILRTEPLWQHRGRHRADQATGIAASADPGKRWGSLSRGRNEAMRNWAHIIQVLGASDVPGDPELAQRVAHFVREMPYVRKHVPGLARSPARNPQHILAPSLERERSRRDIER